MRCVFLALLLSSGRLAAQDSVSTLRAVVVVADKAATPLNSSTAAVTRLTAADLARLPHATVADVLRRVPGIAVVDFDGTGRDPQLMVRGFYGGGEAEYVQVMVDGRAVNLSHNGTIAWETLPPIQNIESIEVVRGSSSTLHGDVAVAGVINIVTRQSPASRSARLAMESFGGIAASADISGTYMGNKDVLAAIGFDRTNGFRDHAERTSAVARASLRYSSTLRFSGQYSWRDFEEPGPLLESRMNDGSETDPRFHFDGGEDNTLDLRLTHDGVLGAGGTMQTTVSLGRRQGNLVRTLPLTTEFSDTKDRELRTSNFGIATQVTLTPTILPAGIERAVAGVALDLSSIDSRYFSDPGEFDRQLFARGDGGRFGLGGFVHVVSTPSEWLRWTVGARVDVLRDEFTPAANDPEYSESHFAFSPKAGVNIRYATSDRTDGRLWISASRTFKTPTLDQLFDQRPIPVPFPPFSVTTSNNNLDPQRGTSVETGVYHEWNGAVVRVGATLTLYNLEMRDELDFDVQTLKYVNIGKSRHRGVEAGLNVSSGIFSAFASATMQDVVARAGDYVGMQLKAVPGQILAGGVTLAPPRVGTATLSVTSLVDMFIDDANTRRIPSWTRVDAQVARSFGSVTIVAGARNLLDERINSTGFLDPAGSAEAYFYPAAGRTIALGIRHGR
jgi:outer membrane cobalamin receptor